MEVRNKAVEIVTLSGLLQKDFESEARALLAFVRDQVRYVGDIDGVETLHDPVTILKMRAGDCDDKAILLASLLLAIGGDGIHRPRFVAVSLQPDRFSHVWVQDFVYGKWVDLEPTEPLDYGSRIPFKGTVKEIYQEV